MKKAFMRHRWPLLFVLIAGLIGMKALFHPGFYTSHDGEHQLVRQYIFDRAVRAGHFPPRFDRQLLHGVGYPLFTFTYQLPFWLGELFVLAGLSFVDAVKNVFVVSFLASGLAMYLFAQERWGRLAGFLSAFLYLWAPYRFLTVLVRASLGEHMVFIFVPLILWSLNRPSHERWRMVVGALSLAGLFLSHAMLAQISLFPLGLFWFAKLLEENSKKKFILHSLSIGLVGLGLSAFYWLPALSYQRNVQGLNRTFYAEHFVLFKQLLYSKWGYTFSVFGPNDGMSFQVGIAQWLAVAGSAIVLLFAKKQKRILIPLAFLVSFILATFLMTGASSEIWRLAVRKYAVVDIPWRFLAVTTVTAALLAGVLIASLKSHLLRIAAAIFLMIVAVYTNRNHLRVNKYIAIDPSFFSSYQGTSNSYDEYKSVFTDEETLKKEKIPEAEVTEGKGEIIITDSKPNRLEVNVTTSGPARVRLNTVYFPGWELWVDGHKQAITETLSSGMPAPWLDTPQSSMKLEYFQTPFMRLANAVSLASGAIVIFILLKAKREVYG